MGLVAGLYLSTRCRVHVDAGGSSLCFEILGPALYLSLVMLLVGTIRLVGALAYGFVVGGALVVAGSALWMVWIAVATTGALGYEGNVIILWSGHFMFLVGFVTLGRRHAGALRPLGRLGSAIVILGLIITLTLAFGVGYSAGTYFAILGSILYAVGARGTSSSSTVAFAWLLAASVATFAATLMVMLFRGDDALLALAQAPMVVAWAALGSRALGGRDVVTDRPVA